VLKAGLTSAVSVGGSPQTAPGGSVATSNDRRARAQCTRRSSIVTAAACVELSTNDNNSAKAQKAGRCATKLYCGATLDHPGCDGRNTTGGTSSSRNVPAFPVSG
jgi:hypothetical protein